MNILIKLLKKYKNKKKLKDYNTPNTISNLSSANSLLECSACLPIPIDVAEVGSSITITSDGFNAFELEMEILRI
jgi:hypothetical protein